MKTLNDMIEKNTMGGCLISARELRQAAIEIIKEQYLCKCSCGADLEHWYEGETQCPIYDKMCDEDWDNAWAHRSEHEKSNPFDSDISIKNFIMKFFNLTEADLND